ncbi:hypothetical protein GGS26DRAFT_592947 [Hypomontagnella submonticulosa]|nr:hypothetical protein GGS26DRAFT_592947 [Hypomontagnella submonticulosa]
MRNPFDPNEHFWGNTSATDVLQLQENEGISYGKNIAILFATSSDLRNMVNTIQGLPEKFNRKVKATINDKNSSVTARNAILLLWALNSLEGDVLGAFVQRIAVGTVHFKLLNVDPTELEQHVEKGAYDRIEVPATPRCLSPLLAPPSQNPNATLFAIYLNAVMEIVRRGSSKDQKLNFRRIRKYLPQVQDLSLWRSPEGAEMYRISNARSFTLDTEEVLSSVRPVEEGDTA